MIASPARVAAAKRQPLRPRVRPEPHRFPDFVDAVTRALLGDHALDAALGPAGSAARRRVVLEGGLRVTTTLRPPDQRLAETAARDRLAGVGVDAALATSVWVGDPRAQVPMRHLFGGGPVYGGTFPALIFHDDMAAAIVGGGSQASPKG